MGTVSSLPLALLPLPLPPPPLSRPAHVCCSVVPSGETTPMPVMSTLRIHNLGVCVRAARPRRYEQPRSQLAHGDAA